MLDFERQYTDVWRHVDKNYRASARNLLHYLAMRRQDLRSLQPRLAALGLSSLGRAESYALSSVSSVLAALRPFVQSSDEPDDGSLPCDSTTGAELLEAHTVALLGPPPPERSVHIMVTMPSEAAHDYTLIQGLVESGMTCMRINCAHDNAADWLKMIEHLRHACAQSGQTCRVLMDLGGPKLRTGAIEPGIAVRKVRPARDALGQVTAPARVWLTARDSAAAPPAAADAVLHVDGRWLNGLHVAHVVRFDDARGRPRTLKIADRDRGGVWAELKRTAYFTDETKLQRAVPKGRRHATRISGIHAAEGVIHLGVDDVLVLTRDAAPGRAASYDSAGRLLSPARVSCTLPEVFADVKAGHQVCLDDGHVVGIAEAVSPEEIRIRIRRTPLRGARLKSDKGINFPESDLHLPALTEKDKKDIAFVVRHADIVGLSFANNERDVLELLELVRTDQSCPGILLKIETRRGFRNLPAMLLTAMRHDRVGVMIARGDLAVECGYERLAEAQEEILWICEAAHCPAIWATQVLETLAKEGTPSRAEITDAAMGHRSECVMLNKGPHINDAVRVLDDILKRMDTHQSKKRAMLRALRLATAFTMASTHS